MAKQKENAVVASQGDEDIRRDINSIIHSNKFEYHDHDRIYVYSQKGKEPVDLNNLLRFARSIL